MTSTPSTASTSTTSPAHMTSALAIAVTAADALASAKGLKFARSLSTLDVEIYGMFPLVNLETSAPAITCSADCPVPAGSYAHSPSCPASTAYRPEAQADELPALEALEASTPFRPATAGQLSFLKTLFAERQAHAGAMEVRQALLALFRAGTLHFDTASGVITWLKSLPRDPRPGPSVTPSVPAGYYAVASATGNNDLDFYRVSAPTEGRWAGRTFVDRVVGGKPEFPVRGREAHSALARILEAGIDASSALYGQEIGRCGRCNRTLTDEVSRSLGLGPDCRARV